MRSEKAKRGREERKAQSDRLNQEVQPGLGRLVKCSGDCACSVLPSHPSPCHVHECDNVDILGEH
eukprot:8716885-Prorocentrum_lima.AAC.1